MSELSSTLLHGPFCGLWSLLTLGRQRLTILIFHRVLAERDWMRPAEPTQEEFDWQMQLLSRHFKVLPLSEAVTRLKEGRLPARAACVTFDDGYRDNATVALPILQKYQLPATVFVAPAYLDGGCMWNDRIIETLRHCAPGTLALPGSLLPSYVLSDEHSRRRAAHDIVRRCKYLEGGQRDAMARQLLEHCTRAAPFLPEKIPDTLMMTKTQVQQLHQAGMDIGGHTWSHPILARLSEPEAREEIMKGKQALEQLLGQPVRTFAYPNGQPGRDYTQVHASLVREAGFELAVTTQWGVSGPQTDCYQLPRFTPWDKSAWRYLLRMALISRQVRLHKGGHDESAE